jgi:di/tripeptidase
LQKDSFVFYNRKMMGTLKQLIAALGLILLFSLPVTAQDSIGAIKDWKIESKKLADGKYELIFSGNITGNWQVYAPNPRSSMIIDLRSVDPSYLQRLESRVTRILQTVEQDTDIRITSRIVGQRPAAALDSEHPLCQGVNLIRKRLKLHPATFSASSTDANLPLSLGIPSLCLGITRGGLAHTIKEYIDIAPILAGVRQLYLTILHSLEPGLVVQGDA